MGLCHNECIDLIGRSQVGIVPFFSWPAPLTECLYEQSARKKRSYCMYVAALLKVKGISCWVYCGSSFWLCRYFFFTSLIFLQLLFSIVSNGNVQINSSLLNPTDYCSNLKLHLNKICILPTVSFVFINWMNVFPIIRTILLRLCLKSSQVDDQRFIQLQNHAYCKLSNPQLSLVMIICGKWACYYQSIIRSKYTLMLMD